MPRKITRMAVVTALLSGSLLAIQVAPATAAPGDSAGSAPAANASAGAAPLASAKDRVAALLRLNPNSRQIDATSVQVAEDVVITVAPDVESNDVRAADLPLACLVGWLCLWENSWWTGERISFTSCSQHNLFDYYMSNGSHWADKTSSYANAQRLATALFYDWKGYWDLLFGDRPGAGNADLSGGSHNDKIDMVDPC